MTNQVQCTLYVLLPFGMYCTDAPLADPGATMTFVAGGALKPIGGHILSHASATRMFLRKGKETRRSMLIAV